MKKFLVFASALIALCGCSEPWKVQDAMDNAERWGNLMCLDRDKSQAPAVNCSTEMTSGDYRVSCQYSYINKKGDGVVKSIRCNVYPNGSCKVPDAVTVPSGE